METIDESSLGSDMREAIMHARQSGEPIRITNEHGYVIARIVPAQDSANIPPTSDNQAWVELNRLIAAISPYLPPHVDAVEVIRDIRR